MYDYLEGRLERRGPARVVVDVGGVGYDVAVPVGAHFKHGETNRVWTHLVVRDDAHLLYGFPDLQTREWFRALLVVRGVGPALALGILSGLSTASLLDAILENDSRSLVAIRGVGRKTAEQILLDLRDKAPRLGAEIAGVIVPQPSGRSAAMADAVQALTSIGYTEKEAQRSVEGAARHVDRNDLELLVRAALKE